MNRPSARALAVLLAVIALVAAAPAMSAYWAGLTHFGTIADGGGDGGGAVTVTRCSRGALVVDWRCRGDYAVSDEMAQPYPPRSDVLLANDSRHHRLGARVVATLDRPSRDAYVWGGIEQARTAAYWAGVLLCILSIGVASLWRRRVGLLLVISILGAALLSAALSTAY